MKAVSRDAPKVGILGGGLSGIAYAYFSSRMGYDVTVLEKENVLGGLMRSINEDGFTFDIGGSHVIFSKDAEVLDLMLKLLGENKVRNRRNTAILYKGRLVKYPFENGLSDLPLTENVSCLIHFLLARIKKGKKHGNLKEFFYNSFGKAISEKYLIPYNEKIWKMKVEDISLDFVGRLPNPKIIDVIKASLGIGSEGYVHQLYFYYPRKGGIQYLVESLREKTIGKIVTGFEVKNAKNESGKWIVSNGSKEMFFDHVVSTIPLHDAVKIFDTPREISSNINHLKYNSLITVAIGLSKLESKNLSWLYIPDRDVHPHRISFPSNFSPENAPEGKASILAEITVKPDDPLFNKNGEEIVDIVVEELDKLKIFSRENVVYSRVFKIKYAYPLLDSYYRENIGRIKSFFNGIGVKLVGRFAEFKYINMDDAIRNAAAHLNILNLRGYE
ncbi:MAG: FAD-dependent oxidoreductase [Thermoproteota archaeon]|nr:FAD-dependent oxidoreductase [Candidatus Brockarchaeota archaeon]